MFSFFLVLGIPLLISCFATITDEAAESGAEKFRVMLTVRRICVNAQWAFAGFYFGAARGVLFPEASSDIKGMAIGLVVASLVLGAVGAIALRRSKLALLTIVVLSIGLFVWFGLTV